MYINSHTIWEIRFPMFTLVGEDTVRKTGRERKKERKRERERLRERALEREREREIHTSGVFQKKRECSDKYIFDRIHLHVHRVRVVCGQQYCPCEMSHSHRGRKRSL